MLNGELLARLLDLALEGGLEILVSEAEQAESPRGTHEIGKGCDGRAQQESRESRGRAEERRGGRPIH